MIISFCLSCKVGEMSLWFSLCCTHWHLEIHPVLLLSNPITSTISLLLPLSVFLSVYFRNKVTTFLKAVAPHLSDGQEWLSLLSILRVGRWATARCSGEILTRIVVRPRAKQPGVYFWMPPLRALKGAPAFLHFFSLVVVCLCSVM